MALHKAADMRKWWHAAILPVVQKKVADMVAKDRVSPDDAKRIVRHSFMQFARTIRTDL